MLLVVRCTMTWNKALMEIIQSDFTKAIMHDWLIALIANCSGQIISLYHKRLFFINNIKII